MKAFFYLILLVALNIASASAQTRTNHLIVIGCDGLSPDGIRKADAANFKKLMREGSFSLRARGVMPTSSSPNWASMIMGAGPEQHGVTSNDWQPDTFQIAPVTRGSGLMFPTIFGQLRQHHPGATIAVFHDWDDFGRLFERNAVDLIEDCDGPTNTMRHAIEFITTRSPLLTFIHLDHVDHAGHEFGHGTVEYYSSVDVADKLIGELIEGLRSASLLDQTILLMTSDHGGVGKGHGGATMAEIEIPWILFGSGIRKGHELHMPINTYDTAVTAAHILRIPPHKAWIGKAIIEAFEE